MAAGEGRLYRETPAALTKAKPPKGRGAAAWEPQDGPWELLGTTSDELTEIGEKLQRSKKDQDRTLAVKVRCHAERTSGQEAGTAGCTHVLHFWSRLCTTIGVSSCVTQHSLLPVPNCIVCHATGCALHSGWSANNT